MVTNILGKCLKVVGNGNTGGLALGVNGNIYKQSTALEKVQLAKIPFYSSYVTQFQEAAI